METEKYNVLLDKAAENRAEFEKIHHTGEYIGSSEVGAICGLNPYRSPLQVWAEMTGKTDRKNLDDNDTLWMGRKLEPIIGELLERKTGHKITPVNQVWQSKAYPWAIFSPDFKIQHKETQREGIVEAKSTKAYAKKHWGEDKAPDSAVLQLHWQLGHSGYDFGMVAGLLGGSADDFYYPTIEASKELFGQVMEKVEEFRECLRKDTPPAVQAMDTALIQDLFPKIAGKEIQLPGEHYALAEAFKMVTLQRKTNRKELENTEELYDDLKAKMLIALGDAPIAYWDDEKIVVSTRSNKGYTVQPFQYHLVEVKPCQK